MDNLESYKNKVNLELKKFLGKKLEKDGKIKDIKELIENLLEYNMRGGKRIRPALIAFAYKCFKDDEKIIPASICIELMQAYLLIHDDIMDKSDLRRGKPTLHKIYGKEDSHLGVSMAILAGDLCAAYVYDSILESDFSEKERLEAIKYLNWIIEREIQGQTLDVILDFKNLTEEDVFTIYELKTATYTTQGPLYLGSVLANANQEKIQALQEYAYNLGIAFQIQDDLNGSFGEIEKIGKPNDSDIKEGGKTLLIVKALEFSDEKDKKFLLEKYGTEVNKQELEKIRQIIKDCGAFDYCKNKLNELVEQAKKAIENLDIKEQGKTLLLETADYIKSLF